MLVSYMDAGGIIKTVEAETVVANIPAFVFARITKGLEPWRLEALSKIKYRPYLVANVTLNFKDGVIPQSIENDIYDVIMTNRSGRPPTEVDQIVTDVVFGNPKNPDPHKRTMTLYMPLPHEGIREALITWTYDTLQQVFQDQLKIILPKFGLTMDVVESIDPSRRGHAIPVAKDDNGPINIYAKGPDGRSIYNKLTAPAFGGRLYLAGQGVTAQPGFEASWASAKTAAVQARMIVTSAPPEKSVKPKPTKAVAKTDSREKKDKKTQEAATGAQCTKDVKKVS